MRSEVNIGRKRWQRIYRVDGSVRDRLSECSHAKGEAEEGKVVGELHYDFVVS